MDVQEGEPPSSKANMGISTGLIFANHFAIRRLASLWAVWNGDWGIPVFGGALPRGRHPIFMDIQRK